MKKLLCAFLALLAVLAYPSRAGAARSDAAVIAAFIQGNTLYTYTALPAETDAAAVSAVARVGDELVFADKNVAVAEAIPATSYLVLLDVSGSMEKHEASVRLFLEEFQKAAKGKLSFALAAVGDKYSFIGEYANADALSEAIAAVEYGAGYTAVYDSLNESLEYYNQKTRAAGQLFGVILISDGEDNHSTATAKDVKRKIADSTPVIIHSILLNATKTNAANIGELSDLTGGLSDELTSDEAGATALAERVARYVNGFFSARFSLPPVEAETEIILNFLIDGQTAYTFDISDAPAAEAPQPESSPETPETPATAETPATEPTAESQEPEPETEPQAGEKSNLTAIIIAAAAFVVVIAVVLLVMKKKNTVARTDGGILLAFDIQSGSREGARIEAVLADELFLGKARSCAVVLRDNGVSPKNTRIFRQDNLIMIEDLNSANGTAIGGMKIFAPNKLQSGAEITVGVTTITVRF
ncbi:MAG: FHA domain-containing protein [Oscillospiraceae bacterium]|jgi:hypothetical protein|nr:FHA domain-containing protein [Oscillospiraceae bacterium]